MLVLGRERGLGGCLMGGSFPKGGEGWLVSE